MLQPVQSKRATEKIVIIVLFGGVVSSLHFVTPTHAHYLHLIYDRLCYFPVILAAYWFGLKGGILMGASMSSMHFAHIYLSWNGHFFTDNLYQTLEACVHLFLGFVTGFLSERFIRASNKLELSYRDLQAKTLQVLNAEEQLRRTERIQALAELSAGVAHEIRTPLASIKGSAEILASETLKPEQRKEFTEILLKESRHLSNIVNEFLSFAQPNKKQQTECRIVETIDAVLDLTLQQRRSKEIAINKECDSELPSIYFDEDQLKQVFVNLINNAIQAMPNGGTVTIITRKEEDSITCLIEDEGVGIPENVIERIFDPFFTTRPNGTGLGLSIVQKIMNHHKGSIQATNRKTGGASFILQFPIFRRPSNE